MRTKLLNIIAWVLSLLVAILAATVWVQNLPQSSARVSTYQLFPLLGLLAFSEMWVHYIVSVLRQYWNIDRAVTKRYFDLTSLVVLILILLHPGLLMWQLWRDGVGLPPFNYLRYVNMSLRWVALLGSVSLMVFLAYELRHWFGQRKWWRFVGYASDAAMLAVFYHGLRLGSNLQSGWFQYVWFLYGATLVLALIYIHGRRFVAKNPTAFSQD